MNTNSDVLNEILPLYMKLQPNSSGAELGSGGRLSERGCTLGIRILMFLKRATSAFHTE